jgi:hypothetical protein
MMIRCVQRGLSVIHRDVERGLDIYPDGAFDYAVLSQTIQTLRDPEKVILELHRVARKVIVSFPNFAHWHCRMQLMFEGMAPQTRQLPFRWYNSPNIHFMSIRKTSTASASNRALPSNGKSPSANTAPARSASGPTCARPRRSMSPVNIEKGHRLQVDAAVADFVADGAQALPDLVVTDHRGRQREQRPVLLEQVVPQQRTQVADR